MTEDRVEVRDLANLNRVLGTLPRAAGYSRAFRLAVMSPLSADFCGDHALADDMVVGSATFHLETHVQTHQAIYLTDSPLEDLLLLDVFRLPGESERRASARQHDQRYMA